MPSFRESMIEGAADLVERLRTHPFIRQTAAGAIPDTVFNRFTIQNYLRLREFERSLAALAARAPESVRAPLRRAMLHVHGSIELYEELAAKLDLDLAKARMTYACFSYVCFLHATANMRSFEESIAAFYSDAFAVHDSWTHAEGAPRAANPRQEFVDLWAGEGIAQWTEFLAGVLDSAALESSQKCRDLMVESFRIGLEHRLRFWDMAFQEADW